ncbi:MAG: ATP-binding cassette domain-containing protein [bacterium]|nr:ATP-binding cassette domain-containing protein [bacterium]
MRLPEKPTLELKNVTKIFGFGTIQVRAVDDINFEAWAGEVVLIMGPSGSGKTTFITIAGAMLRPSQGSVKIDGEEVADADDRTLTKIRQAKIGFIFQSFNLLENLTVFENVLVPLLLARVPKRLARQKVNGLLETFDLTQRRNFRPRKLSGGEQQRVSIARALTNDPKLILADEPTANLDSKKGKEVMRLLSRVAKNMGKTVVVVSHDERLKEIADRILWLEDGRFKEIEILEHDPNCGTRVEKTATTPQLVTSIKTYYFCSKECKEEFEEKQTPPNPKSEARRAL